MQSWNYLYVLSWDEVIIKGKEGWELVEVVDYGENGTFHYMKKPIPGIKEQITMNQTKKALNKEEIL